MSEHIEINNNLIIFIFNIFITIYILFLKHLPLIHRIIIHKTTEIESTAFFDGVSSYPSAQGRGVMTRGGTDEVGFGVK